MQTTKFRKWQRRDRGARRADVEMTPSRHNSKQTAQARAVSI